MTFNYKPYKNLSVSNLGCLSQSAVSEDRGERRKSNVCWDLNRQNLIWEKMGRAPPRASKQTSDDG